MARKRVTALTAISSAGDTDSLLVSQSSADKRIAFSDLADQIKLVTASNSTVARTLEARFAEKCNVKDFGAVGNGLADDTAPIQAAYDALPEQGGIMFFPPGKYRFNLNVTKYNIHMEGSSCVKASNGGDTVDVAFVPYDLTRPVIQVGDDTGYVRGFRMTNCTLYGGSGPYGDCGIYFAGGAYECFVHQCVVWNFKYNFKFSGGADYPCSLIFIDGFASQSSSDANARGFYAISPDWGDSYTTGIYLSNGHVNGPSGSGSYALEADGISIDLANVYFDIADGKGILLGKTNSGAGSPFLRCSNVALDHPHTSSVLIRVTSSSYKTPTSYIAGIVTMQGLLEVADLTQIDLNSGNFAYFPAYTELSYPRVYGQIELQDGATTARNSDVRLLKSGSRGYFQHQTAAIQIAAATDIEFANGANINWKIDSDGVLTSPTTKDLGKVSSAIGNIYCGDVLGGNAQMTGLVLLENNKSISFKDSAGTWESALSVTGSNNLTINSPTLSGSIQVSCRNSSGRIQLLSKVSMDRTKVPVYANNAAAIAGGLAQDDLYRTGGDPDLICIVH